MLVAVQLLHSLIHYNTEFGCTTLLCIALPQCHTGVCVATHTHWLKTLCNCVFVKLYLCVCVRTIVFEYRCLSTSPSSLPNPPQPSLWARGRRPPSHCQSSNVSLPTVGRELEEKYWILTQPRIISIMLRSEGGRYIIFLNSPCFHQVPRLTSSSKWTGGETDQKTNQTNIRLR